MTSATRRRPRRTRYLRCLMLAVLLVSLAPLGALFALWKDAVIREDVNDPVVVQRHMVEQPDALWWTVRGGETTTIYISLHSPVVLPWLVAVLSGIVIPGVLALIQGWCIYGQRRRQRRAQSSSTVARRRKTVQDRLRKYQRVLTEADLVPREDDDASGDKSTHAKVPQHFGDRDAPTHCWQLPTPGCSFAMATRTKEFRLVEDAHCTICLHPYGLGHDVTWSPNAACRHVFHTDCIVRWLIRHTSKHQYCPCCRQGFVKARPRRRPWMGRHETIPQDEE